MSLRRIRGVTRKGILVKPLRFQVAPLDDFGWEASYNWSDYETINNGQFTRASGRQLRTLNINTLAVEYNPPWATIDYQPKAGGGSKDDDEWFGGDDDPLEDWQMLGWDRGPWHVSKKLDQLVMQGTPMLLTVSNPGTYKRPDVRMFVTLRSASLKERAGEPDARYFDLSFVEWRETKIERRQYGRHQLPATVQINKDGVALEIRRGGKKLSRKAQHTIGTKTRPATLRKLSKHYYGSPNQWKRIVRRNDISLRGLGPDDSLETIWKRRKLKRPNQPVRIAIPGNASSKKGKGKGKNRGKGNSRTGGVRP